MQHNDHVMAWLRYKRRRPYKLRWITQDMIDRLPKRPEWTGKRDVLG